MDTEHATYRFSVTIRSNDLAVVNCLRSLSQYSQKSGNNRIPWGGTTDANWKQHSNSVTFRFTSSAYREGFIAEAKHLLPVGLWTAIDQNDNDPAAPQR